MPTTKQNEIITTVNNITPERQRLLETMQTQSFDTITALCEAAGVTRNVYYDALKSQDFVDQLFQESSGLVYAAIPEIMRDIVKRAKRGSYSHQTMLLEMVKLYGGKTPTVAIQNNVQVNTLPTKEVIFRDMPGLLEKVGISKEEMINYLQNL